MADDDDVNMRLFVLIFSGEAKKWFRDLPARSIATFEAFQTAFLEIWGDKISPLQVLSQYNNIKKGGFEYVHEFSSRFMRVYNSIPTDIKPMVGTAKLHYVDSFDGDFALLLREKINKSSYNVSRCFGSGRKYDGKWKNKAESRNKER